MHDFEVSGLIPVSWGHAAGMQGVTDLSPFGVIDSAPKDPHPVGAWSSGLDGPLRRHHPPIVDALAVSLIAKRGGSIGV